MDGFSRATSSGISNNQRRVSKALDAGRLRDDVVEMATKAATSVTEAIQGKGSRGKVSSSAEKEVDAKKCHEDLDHLKQKRKQRKEGRKAEIKQFHMSLRALEGLRYRRQGPVAALAVVSALLGILVNELCVSSDYVTDLSESMLDEIKAANGRACNSKAGDPIKVLVTITTILLMAATFKQWQLKAEIMIQRQQLEDWMYLPGGSLARTNIPVSTYMKLVVEFIVCAIHPLPYVRGDFEFSVDSDNSVFYRFESVTVAVMVLRLYHLWRWFYLMATWKFTNLEDSFVAQDFATIERLSESNSSIARTTFPLKVMMAIHPVRVICCVVATLFLAITYLVRITEGPAGQLHSQDWWEQMWVTITQGTTGYGGSPPWTQWGRLCAVLMMCLGPMTVSVMTAATTKSITLNHEEGLVFRSMQHNTLRVAVMSAAARIVQFWWRQKQAMRRMGVHAAPRSTNIAVAFLSAIAPRRIGSFKARHGIERMRHSTIDSASPEFGASGQLGMIREVSAKDPSPRSAAQASRIHSPRGRGVESPAASRASPHGRGVAGWTSPSLTPRQQQRATDSRQSSINSSEQRQTQRPSLLESIPASLGLSVSSESAAGAGAGGGGGGFGARRSRMGNFVTLKHLVPFWEEDTTNKKVQLLRNFYVALEEYDRFLANNKTAVGSAATTSQDRAYSERQPREDRSGSIGLSRPGPVPLPSFQVGPEANSYGGIATPIHWANGSRGQGMRGSRRRMSETSEFGRLEGGSVGSWSSGPSDRKLRADMDLVQSEVQDLREGMKTMMAMLQRIEAAVCPNNAPSTQSATPKGRVGYSGVDVVRDGAGVGLPAAAQTNAKAGRDRPACVHGAPKQKQTASHHNGEGRQVGSDEVAHEERRMLRPPSLIATKSNNDRVGRESMRASRSDTFVTADYVSSDEGRVESMVASSTECEDTDHIVPDTWEERLICSPSAEHAREQQRSLRSLQASAPLSPLHQHPIASPETAAGEQKPSSLRIDRGGEAVAGCPEFCHPENDLG